MRSITSFIFEVPYVIPWLEYSRSNSKALDQGTYVDLHGAVWTQWFNHTVQPGLDTLNSKLIFPLIPVCTHMRMSEFLRNETLIQ